eukprot:GILI01022767.1.p2 GENE.GILI01022767.1~~GILI01022767.1.p2  ORF type:complete len:133 (-),score=4.75 GILI01022767.1:125-523(-)
MSAPTQYLVPLPTTALFCPDCGRLLDLPGVNEPISCNLCGYHGQQEAHEQREIVTSSRQEKKMWLEKIMGRLTSEQEGGGPATRASIKMNCPAPKCTSKKLNFYTMQLRSADEGQTVFYECPKCSHKFSVNT